MKLNRRSFLEGLFSTASLTALSGCESIFVAPAGWRASGKPKLVFGVLSDLHVRLWKDGKRLDWKHDTKIFRKALEYFKSRHVDAVVIAGDLADRGLVEELQFVADEWYRVFPEGCGVEKIFVFGNHDLDGYDYDHGYLLKSAFPDEATRESHLLKTDVKGNWERIFHERTDSLFTKTVKGYTFIGQHWDRHEACENGDYGTLLKEFLALKGEALKGRKPFFYVQHSHLANTVFGPWAWGHDDGETTKALKAFPNAVAFSGHSHFTETDERAIWQGGFTSVCCSSLRYTGLVDCLRGDVKPDYENGFKGGECSVMKRYDANDGHQGLLVSVYEDAIVYERREFQANRALGPDWVQVLGEERFDFESRKAREAKPQFAADATVTCEEVESRKRGKGRQKELPSIRLSWPAANATSTRPYGYRVRIANSDGEEIVRSVLAEGYHLPIDDPRAQGASVIILAKEILPKGTRLTVRVAPFSSLAENDEGLCGEEISSTVL